VVAVLEKNQKPLEDAVFDASVAENNPLANQVRNVGRGNKGSLKSLRAGDLLYVDHRERPIPIPVLTSYAQGLKPVEYWGAGFGARAGVWATKNSTQKSGFLGKQLTQVSHRLVVSREDEPDHDPEDRRGLPVPTDDPDNDGAYLARAVGPYPRDTPLSPAILRHLKALGHGKILVRSPTVGGPSMGGVYARDVGVRERGGLAPAGDFVGIAAASALAEKMTQGMLSSKHSGGVAGANKTVGGYAYINSLIQTPRTFPGGSAHAQRDGRVSSIAEAPQGGHYIEVDGERHYTPAESPPTVKVNDRVEAGDVLSDGIANPAEVVRHKGIGEGRRRFVDTFAQAYRNTGMGVNRRNVELLARGLIDHVEVDDEIPGTDHIPGDVVPYQSLESAWVPRPGARHLSPASAVNKYLEKPVLHHTIGTKVRPSMLPDLEAFGVNNVLVHDDPPPFTPVMVRGMGALQLDPDWMTRHLGSNLQKSTLEAVHRGRISDTAGTSFVPALAADRGNFGRHGATRGWHPSDLAGADARDADRDGLVGDGTPRERRASLSVLD
jgi:hypothetical protein